MRTLEQLRNVRVGDMTSEEAKLVVAEACRRLQAEFAILRPALEKALELDCTCGQHAEGGPHASSCPKH